MHGAINKNLDICRADNSELCSYQQDKRERPGHRTVKILSRTSGSTWHRNPFLLDIRALHDLQGFDWHRPYTLTQAVHSDTGRTLWHRPYPLTQAVHSDTGRTLWHRPYTVNCSSIVELHLFGIIETDSHPDKQNIPIIGFFFDNRLHWESEVRLLLFTVRTYV